MILGLCSLIDATNRELRVWQRAWRYVFDTGYDEHMADTLRIDDTPESDQRGGDGYGIPA